MVEIRPRNVEPDLRSILFDNQYHFLLETVCFAWNYLNSEDIETFFNLTNCPRTFWGHCTVYTWTLAIQNRNGTLFPKLEQYNVNRHIKWINEYSILDQSSVFHLPSGARTLLESTVDVINGGANNYESRVVFPPNQTSCETKKEVSFREVASRATLYTKNHAINLKIKLLNTCRNLYMCTVSFI